MNRLADSPASPPHAYGGALAVIAATTGAGFLLREVLDLANIVMLFLLAVFLVAVRLGRGPAVMTAFLAVGLFDFFFVPPHLSFAVSDVQYLVTFTVMLAVGLVTAHLVAGIRDQAALARQREQETRELYEMARALGGALDLAQVAEITQRFLLATRMLDSALFLLDAQQQLTPALTTDHPLGSVESGFARMSLDRGEVVEIDALAGTGMAAAYLPLRTPLQVRGVLAISPREADEDRFRAQRPLLESIASLVAIAVERLHYVEVIQNNQLQIVAERLRSSILSALSHDLRTPLTSLVGMADALTLRRPPLPAEAIDVAASIRDQARGMNQLLGNLLDMARLQAGKVALRKEWQPLEEVVGSSTRLVAPALARHRLSLDLPRDLPLVCFDAVLMERVLCNLLENGAKYSAEGSTLTLSARVGTDTLVIEIRDTGPGFPPGMESQVFDLFTRGETESTTPGAGLGLAICKAIVEAHGGQIVAFNLPEGGGCIRITLPQGTPPEVAEEAP